jgi:hypothetical protein
MEGCEAPTRCRRWACDAAVLTPEWLGRQHHALLTVMRMYCQTITAAHPTPELHAHMLLEGALAAAVERQRLSLAVRASTLATVLNKNLSHAW